MSENNYVNRYITLTKKISLLEEKFGRDVKLITVSKNQSYEKIIELKRLGQNDFGENYVDEAYEKNIKISDTSISWHFIGKVQSNKIKKICTLFDWIHTVSSSQHAIKINDSCNTLNKTMNICIQINIDSEDSKNGIMLDEYDNLSSSIENLSNIKLRGIMAIPKAGNDSTEAFSKMYKLYKKHLNLDTLSMGMSSDFISAIENGSNMLRIGQEIFGKRS